jgi:hypothetical protein
MSFHLEYVEHNLHIFKCFCPTARKITASDNVHTLFLLTDVSKTVLVSENVHSVTYASS